MKLWVQHFVFVGYLLNKVKYLLDIRSYLLNTGSYLSNQESYLLNIKSYHQNGTFDVYRRKAVSSIEDKKIAAS